MKTLIFSFEGVIPALLTPLLEGGRRVDEEALRELCAFLIKRGVHGLMPCGTTGEGPLLSLAERKRVAEAVLEAAAGQVPVIVHVGAATTQETIELAKHAHDRGADACSVVTPYYYHLGEKALIDHFSRVANSLPHFPFFIYNIPQNTGHNLSPQVVQTIAESQANVVGIKDSSGDLSQLLDYLKIRAPAFNVVVGSDGLIFPALAMGIRASISGNANVFPEVFVALFEAFKNGDYGACRAIQEKINGLARLMGYGRDLSLFKKILGKRGVPVGDVRAPLQETTPNEVESCAKALRELGLLKG